MVQPTEPSVRVAGDLAAAFAAAVAGERVVVERDGQRVAVIPIEDLDCLLAAEAEEDEQLNHVADAAMAEFEASGEALVPWEDVKAKAGLA